MSEHTPIPWLRDGRLIYALEHDSWRKGVEQLRNRFQAWVQGYSETPAEELDANARLMFAAPDLIEALAGWMVSAWINGVYLPDDMAKWAASVLKGKTRTPAEVTRSIIAQLNGSTDSTSGPE